MSANLEKESYTYRCRYGCSVEIIDGVSRECSNDCGHKWVHESVPGGRSWARWRGVLPEVQKSVLYLHFFKKLKGYSGQILQVKIGSLFYFTDNISTFVWFHESLIVSVEISKAIVLVRVE